MNQLSDAVTITEPGKAQPNGKRAPERSNGNPGQQKSPAANSAHEPAAAPSRRAFLRLLGVGAVIATVFGQGYAFLRSLVPNVLYEEPLRFKVGSPVNLAEGATYLDEKRVFVFRKEKTYHAISAACTHLGCTVKLAKAAGGSDVEFHCPCHGSKFRADGTNYAGPAPKPLNWVKLEVAPEDGQLVVNLSEKVEQNFMLTV